MGNNTTSAASATPAGSAAPATFGQPSASYTPDVNAGGNHPTHDALAVFASAGPKMPSPQAVIGGNGLEQKANSLRGQFNDVLSMARKAAAGRVRGLPSIAQKPSSASRGSDRSLDKINDTHESMPTPAQVKWQQYQKQNQQMENENPPVRIDTKDSLGNEYARGVTTVRGGKVDVSFGDLEFTNGKAVKDAVSSYRNTLADADAFYGED